MVSFYDPSLTSLVEARRSMTREEYRAANISKSDIASVRADVAEMIARDPNEKSGVDWLGLAQVIQERFSDRLPYMQYLLRQPVGNLSARVDIVRKHLMVSLVPYMRREEIGESQWFAKMARSCADSFTSHLPVEGYTKQERVLHHAVHEVLHEICRVYTEAWRDAFDIEEQTKEEMMQLMDKWRGDFDALTGWLDWPAWIQCDPPCGVDEYCYFPQGAPWDVPGDHTPRCSNIDDGKF